MIPQALLLSWTSLFSFTMTLSTTGSQASGSLYPTVASQKITTIEDKLRHIDDMRTWTSSSRMTDVLRRLESLDSRVSRIEIFLERKMDGIQDKLAYLEGKLETRLDKLQASMDAMSTRTDRGVKLMTNKVVDLERSVQTVRQYCNASANSALAARSAAAAAAAATASNNGGGGGGGGGGGAADQLQIQSDGSETCNALAMADGAVDKINKNLAQQLNNVTYKLNSWYNDLWRRSNSIESTLKSENNQSRWEVYDGIMQILNRWEITDEAIHDVESNMKERFTDLYTTHKEILKSFTEKETKLAGILDGFLNVLVYNATRAFSQIQLTQELIKTHNSHMLRTIESTNKLVLSCQEDNKALKGALLLTGAQYKLEWDDKHEKLREDVGVTQSEITDLRVQLKDFLKELNSTKITSPTQSFVSTLQAITDKMLAVTSTFTHKCPVVRGNATGQRHANKPEEEQPASNRAADRTKSKNTSSDIFGGLNRESVQEILGNASQVHNFLSGFHEHDKTKDTATNGVNKKKSETSTTTNSQTSDYADVFGTQDYDDAEEEYTE